MSRIMAFIHSFSTQALPISYAFDSAASNSIMEIVSQMVSADVIEWFGQVDGVADIEDEDCVGSV